MQASTRASIWLFLIAFALVFYGMGASFVESFVNYPTWRLIGANEFRSYHRALGPLVIGYMVIPLIITTVLTMLLVWSFERTAGQLPAHNVSSCVDGRPVNFMEVLFVVSTGVLVKCTVPNVAKNNSPPKYTTVRVVALPLIA